jgi:hypothetical protein
MIENLPEPIKRLYEQFKTPFLAPDHRLQESHNNKLSCDLHDEMEVVAGEEEGVIRAFRCKKCGGEFDCHAYLWYLHGLEHAEKKNG